MQQMMKNEFEEVRNEFEDEVTIMKTSGNHCQEIKPCPEKLLYIIYLGNQETDCVLIWFWN